MPKITGAHCSAAFSCIPLIISYVCLYATILLLSFTWLDIPNHLVSLSYQLRRKNAILFIENESHYHCYWYFISLIIKITNFWGIYTKFHIFLCTIGTRELIAYSMLREKINMRIKQKNNRISQMLNRLFLFVYELIFIFIRTTV